MKKKIVTVLMTAMLEAAFYLHRQLWQQIRLNRQKIPAKADETSEAKTEELKTIGEKPEKETEGVLDVKLKNLTGKVVTGFAVKNEKDEKYPENFLKEDDKFAADEERELWFDTNKKDETSDTERRMRPKKKKMEKFRNTTFSLRLKMEQPLKSIHSRLVIQKKLSFIWKAV